MKRHKPLKRSPLRRVSKKHKAELEKYYRLRDVFLRENKFCQCGVECCAGDVHPAYANQIHHRRRRGRYLNDVSTWMAVCAPCHEWIESHGKESRLLGWLLT